MNYSPDLDQSVIEILEKADLGDDLKQRITNYLEQNLSKIQPPKIDDETIYHYTSPSGLRGIIEKHQIWASNVAYLNDSREFYEALDRIDESSDEMRCTLNTIQLINSMMRKSIKDAQPISLKVTEDIVKKAIEESIIKVGTTEAKERKLRATIGSEKKEIEESVAHFYQLFSTLQSKIEESKQELKKQYLDDDTVEKIVTGLLDTSEQETLLHNYIDKIDNFLRTKKDRDYYVSCFTHNCDQLSQWRGYGSYAVVGFDTPKLINNLVPSVQGVKIIYDQQEQEKRVESLLDMVVAEFTDIITASDQSYDIKEVLIDTIFEIDKIYLNQYLVLFKDKGFCEEEERRLYLSVTRDETDKYQIRERNGIFFPYVELKMKENKQLPIKEIYLSPRTPEEFERAKIGLQYLLKKNGYELKEENNVSGVEIKPSSIPLRV